MTGWSLSQLLAGLHDEIERRLAIARKTLGHSVTKGSASENVWFQLLETYLPQRYRVASAHVVDSKGDFSDQIDVVVFDRQYSPFIFAYEGETIIPAESVYAVFETKQTINSANVRYAQDKVASVRRLHRTSLPIPHAGGTFPARSLPYLLGGLLTFESEWSPALGEPLRAVLDASDEDSRLDLGCIAAHGWFCCDENGVVTLSSQAKAATAFLLELIALLQNSATVPMIDIRAYGAWLAD